MLKQFLLAALIGTAISFALLGVSVYAGELGYVFLARLFDWPNALLQSLVPPDNIGTTAHPILEGSPLSDLAFFVSVPFGALVYGVFAFIWLRRRTWRAP